MRTLRISLLAAGPHAQAARCLSSCHAVAVALRCDLPSAMLACTIYAAAPPGAEAGLQRSLVARSLTSAAQCLEAFLDHDQQAVESQNSAAAGAGAGQMSGCEGGGAQGEACSSSDRAEADKPSLPVDDYLRPPPPHVRLASPLLTYVAVPALPRGAQVEFQPVALAGNGRPGVLHFLCLLGVSVSSMSHMVLRPGDC